MLTFNKLDKYINSLLKFIWTKVLQNTLIYISLQCG